MEIYRVRISRVDDLGDLVRVYYFDKPAGFDWDEGAHVTWVCRDLTRGKSVTKLWCGICLS